MTLEKTNALRSLLIIAVVATGYYVTGRLGLLLAVPPGYATAVWPPSGVALASVLIFGGQCWPGILLGSFALNLFTTFNPADPYTAAVSALVAIVIACGATLQAGVGGWVIKNHIDIPNPLERMRDIAILILLGGPACCVINSTVGVITLSVAHLVQPGDIPINWLTWWVGDSIGVMVFTPFLLLLFNPLPSISTPRKLFVALMLAATFAITIYMFVLASRAEYKDQNSVFMHKAALIDDRLDNKLRSYTEALLSIERLYDSSEFVSREEFRVFTSKIFDQHQGIYALGWAPLVPDKERRAYEHTMRQVTGNPAFSIQDRLPNGSRFTSPRRPFYFPGTYSETSSTTQTTPGFDAYSEPTRKKALELARDTATMVMTEKVTIFSNNKKMQAVIIYHPVYDTDLRTLRKPEYAEHIKGFIFGAFVFEDMLSDIVSLAKEQNLKLSLIDPLSSQDDRILFRFPAEEIHPAKHSRDFEYNRSIPLAGREWLLQISPSNVYFGQLQRWAVWFVLVGGVIFTGLFGIFLLIVTGRTDLVERLVKEKTEKLLVQEKILEDINSVNNSVLLSSPYLIIGIGKDGTIIVFNKAAEDALGYSANEVMHRETPAILHKPEEIMKRSLELTRELGRPVNPDLSVFTLIPTRDGMEAREWTFVRKDGTTFPGELTVAPMRDKNGFPVGFIGIIQDISERKKIEQMKSEFISIVSHELRTPLTSIRGSLGLIASGKLGELPEKASAMAAIAHKNSERLVKIINDILDIEKLESDKMQMNIQAIKVDDLLNQAIESTYPYGEKYNISFTLEKADPHLNVLADPDRLMQVLANLMSNAAKFSPNGSTVRLRAYAAPYNRVRFEIEDQGPGIPEKFRTRIFQKFQQLDSSNTRSHEGTGLGLSIAKQFVIAMGGDIGFTSETGKGSIFYFELPQVLPQVDILNRETPKNILICEDDEHVAGFIKSTLESAGFNARITTTAEDALEELKSGSFAAITLDLSLPYMDGAEFLRRLRNNPETFTIPVIVISAKADEKRKTMNGDAIGVIDWLTKPMDHLKLINTLRTAIAHTNEKMPKILHIEDDEDFTRIMAESMRGYARFISAPTLKDAYRELHSQRLDLVILDLAMPDGSGLEMLNHIRENLNYTIPVLILSASETTADVQRQVAKVLVKSRMSEEKILETIMGLIQPPAIKDRAIA